MSQSYNISVECVADAHDDSVGSGGDGDQGKHVFVKVREARRLVLTSLYGTLMVSTNKKSLIGQIIQVSDPSVWVRCASGNV